MFTYVFADALVQCGGTAAGTGRCAGRFKEICPRCWSSSRAPDQLEGPSRPRAGRWSAWTSCPNSHPPSAATFCAGTTAPPSRPGASTLCGRHPFAPNTPRRSPQGPAGSTRGMRWCFGPSRSSPTSRRDSGPSRTRRRDCSRQGPLCSASDSSTPHTACTVHPLRSRHASGRTCAGRPAADSAGPATAARPGRTAGTRAPHKGVPEKSASATRTFAGSPVSCCTAFQRRSVTRLQRQQARLNRKAGPAPEHGKHAEDARDGSI